MIFDTHAHYDDRQFEEDREELLGSMRENGVELIVDAGSDIASWDKIEQLTDRYPFIYGAIGVHPDEVGELDEEKMKRMEQLLARENVVYPAAGTCETTGFAGDHSQPGSSRRYDGDYEAVCRRIKRCDPLFFLFPGAGERVCKDGILSWNRWCRNL